jgi:hypothetical protein
MKKSEKFKTELSKILIMTKTLEGKIISEIEKKVGKTEIIFDNYIIVPLYNPLSHDSCDSMFEIENNFYIEKVTINGVLGPNNEYVDIPFSELNIDILLKILEEIETGRFSLVEEENF